MLCISHYLLLSTEEKLKFSLQLYKYKILLITTREQLDIREIRALILNENSRKGWQLQVAMRDTPTGNYY